MTNWTREEEGELCMYRKRSPCLTLFLALARLASSGFAATISVTGFDSTVADDGVCTLREALTSANTDTPSGNQPGECRAGSGADVIRLTGNVTLTAVDNDTEGWTALPSVVSNVFIEGNGFFVERSLLGGTLDFRIFHVAAGAELTLDHVTVKNGFSDLVDGGGIYSKGTLTILDSSLTDHTTRFESGGAIYSQGGELIIFRSSISGSQSIFESGGGVYASGSVVRIYGSTISANQAYKGGGGIYQSSGILTLEDSTVSGNIAGANGGGIVMLGGPPHVLGNCTVSGNSVGILDSGAGIYFSSISGSLVVTNCSLVGNSVPGSTGAGGIRNGGGTVTLVNTILANGSSSPYNCSGDITDGGNNLADDTSCGFPDIPANLNGVDPSLADNGGPTKTHALLPGSTAIDHAGSCGSPADQRGAARIPPCDSGAFEVIGCALLEIDSQIIDSEQVLSTCNTALLGPDLIVQGAGGDLTVNAGYLITIRDRLWVDQGANLNLNAGHLVAIKNGLWIDRGAELQIGIDPLLLP
jgi:hypothetical protein